jgi:hypothetical protein
MLCRFSRTHWKLCRCCSGGTVRAMCLHEESTGRSDYRCRVKQPKQKVLYHEAQSISSANSDSWVFTEAHREERDRNCLWMTYAVWTCSTSRSVPVPTLLRNNRLLQRKHTRPNCLTAVTAGLWTVSDGCSPSRPPSVHWAS